MKPTEHDPAEGRTACFEAAGTADHGKARPLGMDG